MKRFSAWWFTRVPIGTRSLLVGAHQFLIHPFCLALGWFKLFGPTFNPIIWASFFLHDSGYANLKDMDREEGLKHPELGAHIMHLLFDGWSFHEDRFDCLRKDYTWHDFCLYHSRRYAKLDGKPTSKLCVADKMAFMLTPKWLFFLTTRMSGELAEFMDDIEARKAHGEVFAESTELYSSPEERWLNNMRLDTEIWIAEEMIKWM